MKGKAEKTRGARVRASRARTRVEARRKARAAASKNAARAAPAAPARGLRRAPAESGADARTARAATGSRADGRKKADAPAHGGIDVSREKPRSASPPTPAKERKGKKRATLRKERAREEKAARRERARAEDGPRSESPPAPAKEREGKKRATLRKERAREEKAARRERARAEERPRPERSAASAASPRERRRRGARPRLRLTVLSTLLFLSLAALLWVYTGTGVLNVKRIEVKGNERLDSSYIRQLSGIDENTHLIKMNGGKVKEALLTEPYIAGVDISRRFPYTVVITVEEREPQGFVVQNGKHYLVDREGVVLEGIEERPQGMVEIKGLAAPLLYPGRTIAGEDFAGIAALLQSLPAELEAAASAAGCDQADGLYLESGGTKIIYGSDAELERKNLIASMALQQLVGRYAAVEYIDVSIPDHPVIKPAS